MSIWEEQQKILEDNLTEVKARKPEYVNRHVLEAIEQRENIKATLEDMSLFDQLKEKGYNPTMKIVKHKKFMTVISIPTEVEYFGESHEDAAAAAHRWLKDVLDYQHEEVEFSFHTYEVSDMCASLKEEYGEESYLWPPLETRMHYGE